MDLISEFENERDQRIKNQQTNIDLQSAVEKFTLETIKSQYSYNFSWLGRPVIQYPQDMMAMQEIIWKVKPDLIIETGIAHGGSLIGGDGIVVGVDIDIRPHNKLEIEKHPMSKRIKMIQGSSIDSNIVQEVSKYLVNKNKVLVILDSNHTHAHVLKELEYYSIMVSIDSYLLVFDTIVEDLPAEATFNRPWGKSNNPKTAVWEFLKSNDSFVVDRSIENKILVTVAPDGYLKRVR
jgi:cephalosporin hydroxylase